jgi:hypothetical protein
MFNINILRITLVLLLTFGLSDLAVADPVDVTGNWQGSWNSVYGDIGGLSATITQSGTTLGGRLTIANTECGTFSDLVLSGSVSGNIISVNTSAICPADQSYNALNFTNGTVNGNSISGNYTVYSDGEYWDSGTFSLTRAVNIITASAGAGGIISPSGAVLVNAGSNRTFQFIPNPGYRVLDVKVDGLSVGRDTSHTFINVSSNHTITVTFKLSPQGKAMPWIPLLLLEDNNR